MRLGSNPRLMLPTPATDPAKDPLMDRAVAVSDDVRNILAGEQIPTVVGLITCGSGGSLASKNQFPGKVGDRCLHISRKFSSKA